MNLGYWFTWIGNNPVFVNSAHFSGLKFLNEKVEAQTILRKHNDWSSTINQNHATGLNCMTLVQFILWLETIKSPWFLVTMCKTGHITQVLCVIASSVHWIWSIFRDLWRVTNTFSVLTEVLFITQMSRSWHFS